LGLAIVRQVVDQLGGSVTAEPAPGRGTLMRVRLPGAETVDLADEPSADTLPPTSPVVLEGRNRSPV
jgi:hypothetical protein